MAVTTRQRHAKEAKSRNTNRKELFSLNIIKDLENTSGLLATAAEDLLHIHGGNNGVYSSGEVIDPCRPLVLPDLL